MPASLHVVDLSKQQARRGLLATVASGADLWQVIVRIGAAGLALLANLLLARYLSIEQLAYYFTFGTLAYFGNALVFVGASMYLQRVLAPVAFDGSIAGMFLLRYVGGVAAAGGALVLAGTALYLFLLGRTSILEPALACAALSIGTFFSSVSKDLWALCGKPRVSALLVLFEQLGKFSLFALVIGGATATQALALIGVAALAAGVTGMAGGAWLVGSSGHGSMLHEANVRQLLRTVFPAGVSGILNWLQLQLYRPLMLYAGAPATAIGATALLTTLGSTGANPALTVVTQKFIPAIYRRESGAVTACLKRCSAMAAGLACVALPAAWLFLIVSDRRTLLRYLPLVAVGVLVEAGNAAIGVFTHARNSAGRSLWLVSASTAVGAVIAVACLQIEVPAAHLPFLVGGGLLVSQLAAVLLVSAGHYRYQRT